MLIGLVGRPLPPRGAFLTSLPLVEIMLAIAVLAVASTVSLNQVTPPPPGNVPDPLWQHSAHTWLLDMALQVALGAVFIALTWWRLLQLSPGRRR